MSRIRRRLPLAPLALLALLAVLPLVTRAPHAYADGSTAAGALFREAREDASRGDYEHACPRFAESLRLAPAAGTMLNLGDCEEHRGHVADAVEQFKHALEALPPNDDRIPFARERVAKLAPRVPHLLLRALRADTNAAVTLDGTALGEPAFGIALPLNPGPHRLVVRAAGHRDREYPLVLAEAETTELGLEVGPPAPVVADVVAPSAPPPGRSRNVLAWSALGVGGVGIVTSTVTGIAALHLASVVKDRCPNGVCNDANDLDRASHGKTFSTTSTVAGAIGIAGVALAVVLFLTQETYFDAKARSAQMRRTE